MTYISLFSNFALYLEEYLMYKHRTYGFMSQSDTKINVGHSTLYSRSSNFALYLEECLMYKHTSGLCVFMTRRFTSK